MLGSGLCSEMVPVAVIEMVSGPPELLAVSMASRRVSGPESAVLSTVNVMAYARGIRGLAM